MLHGAYMCIVMSSPYLVCIACVCYYGCAGWRDSVTVVPQSEVWLLPWAQKLHLVNKMSVSQVPVA